MFEPCPTTSEFFTRQMLVITRRSISDWWEQQNPTYNLDSWTSPGIDRHDRWCWAGHLNPWMSSAPAWNERIRIRYHSVGERSIELTFSLFSSPSVCPSSNRRILSSLLKGKFSTPSIDPLPLILTSSSLSCLNNSVFGFTAGRARIIIPRLCFNVKSCADMR